MTMLRMIINTMMRISWMVDEDKDDNQEGNVKRLNVQQGREREDKVH